MTVKSWVAIDGGDWNNDPTADPATGVGGTDLGVLDGLPLFPTIGGSSFGPGAQTANFGASAFSFVVPSGFTGWPHSGGGFTTLNAATIGGPAGVQGTLSNGNLTFTASIGGTFVQAFDGQTIGKYYFEVHYDHIVPIADYFGAGVARAFPGLVYSNFALTNGAYDGSSPNGGVICKSGHPFIVDYPTELGALTAQIATGSVAGGFGPYRPGAVLRFAIDMGAVPPVPTAGVGDLWFGNVSGFVDLSDPANRRKFVGDNGSAQNLGTDGGTPFGSAPSVFLTLVTPEETTANFATNAGIGGAFAVVGSTMPHAASQPLCSVSTIVSDELLAPGIDPKVVLSVSDDGARTWKTIQKERSLGRLGEYTKRVRWLKMGQFRQRVIMLEITDPVRRNIVGFYHDLKEGMD